MLHFWLLLLLVFCAARRMAIKLWANMNNPLMMINYVENFILTNLCKLIVAGYESDAVATITTTATATVSAYTK